MSRLRPTLRESDSNSYCPRGVTAYYEVLAAVEQQNGLLHGKLDGPKGEHCALGSYFDIHSGQAFPSDLIDEIASVNDSVPKASPQERKRFVTRWLKWKLGTLGMPYRTPKPRVE